MEIEPAVLPFDDFVKSNMIPRLHPTDDPNRPPDAKFDSKFRVIVCEHWITGLCQNGNDCSFLHRYDLSKMPHCVHGRSCKIKNCPKKHGDVDSTECVFYKQGFCFHGPMCNHRHITRPPEACPEEASFEPGNHSTAIKVQQPNENYKVTLCSNWLLSGNITTCQFGEGCHYAHGEDDIRDGQQAGSEMLRDEEIYDPTRSRLDAPLDLPCSTDEKLEFFIIQAPDLRSLRIGKETERWKVTRKSAEELNKAFRRAAHVFLFFVVRSMKGIYGVGRMDSLIRPPIIGMEFSREFYFQWIRTLRVSMRSIAQMKVGSTGMLVGKTRIDSILDYRIGMDLLRISFRKPEWDWTADFDRANSFTNQSANSNAIPLENSTTLSVESLENGNNGTSSNNNSHSNSSTNKDHSMEVDEIDDIHENQSSVGKNVKTTDKEELFSKDWEATMIAASNEVGPPWKGGYMKKDLPKNHFYKGDTPGFVFCEDNPAVIEEMFRLKLFGLPGNLTAVAAAIDQRCPLFVLDTSSRILYGIFQAVSTFSHNINPTAFQSLLGDASSSTGTMNIVSSPRPLQVKVECAMTASPLSLQDPACMAALDSTHVGGGLTMAQTLALCDLLATRAGVWSPSSMTMASGSLSSTTSTSSSFNSSNPRNNFSGRNPFHNNRYDNPMNNNNNSNSSGSGSGNSSGSGTMANNNNNSNHNNSGNSGGSRYSNPSSSSMNALYGSSTNPNGLINNNPGSGSSNGNGNSNGNSNGSSGSGNTFAEYYQPPFPYVEEVFIGIPVDPNVVKRRLLGPSASLVLNLIMEVCGNRNSAKIRIRGQGSGFFEGPMGQELPKPLHFNVSAENETILSSLVARLKEMIAQARIDLTSTFRN